jgi:RND superfamily putative drug exporter
MVLLGKWNWYLPSWLEWLPEIGIEGTTAHVPAQVETVGSLAPSTVGD